MTIPNTRELKHTAQEQLSRAKEEKRIVTIYAGLFLCTSLLVTLANYIIGLQIDKTGGLSNMGLRSVLSALQTVLPLVQSAVLMCLEVGYLSAMLRIARGQYASPQSLRLGFDRFWVLLRYSVIKGMIYFALAFVSVYLATMIYVMTPLSDPAMELLAPLFENLTVMNANIVLDDSTYAQLVSVMTPVFILCGVIFFIAVIPVFYRYRMVTYLIIDKPGISAMAAMRESTMMMRRNKRKLLRVDLSLWLYYSGLLVASAICYGDTLLAMLGIRFPWSAEIGFFLFYALYLAAAFLVYYMLGNRAAVTYGLVYESLKPEEKQPEGVVLGNIFQM